MKDFVNREFLRRIKACDSAFIVVRKEQGWWRAFRDKPIPTSRIAYLFTIPQLHSAIWRILVDLTKRPGVNLYFMQQLNGYLLHKSPTPKDNIVDLALGIADYITTPSSAREVAARLSKLIKELDDWGFDLSKKDW